MRRFKVFWTGTVFLALLGCAADAPPQRPSRQYSIEQFLDTISISGGSFSPDEQELLLTSDASGIFNAYTVPVQGGELKQLTHSQDNAVMAISFFPNDRRVLYMSDQGGNEIFHLFVLNEDGSFLDLTPEEGVRSLFFDWSHDEQSFYYTSNKRDRRFMDLYEMPVADLVPRMVYRNEEGFQIGAVAPNRRYLALTRVNTNHDNDLYLHDLETGETKHLSPHEGEVSYSPQTFSPDSRSLYYLTDEGSEFTYVMRYDLETGERVKVEEAPWDIMFMGLSRSGRYRLTGINNDARIQIRIFDTVENKELDLGRFPQGQITGVRFSRSERLLSFLVEGSRSPDNLYVYDLEKGESRQLTDSMNPEIDPEDLVEAEVVRYPSFDGLEIPAILYKPHQAAAGHKVPALVWVHGGPGGQSRIGYSALIQYLVNHGYAVLAVNNRGSSGYGKTFFKLDDRRHGQDDLADCVEAKKFLLSTGYVEEGKIGIIGGSYGGYMVLAALAFRPEEFAVGVDIFGVANWLRTLQSIPPWWESFRKALYQELGDPAVDEEYLRSISPLFHAEKIRRPLLVLQGANDPRVLKVESDEIVEAVRRNGVPVEYIVFEDEGHGFRSKANRIRGYEAILQFLERYLKGEGETSD